jgi:hypothetical protein
MTSDNYTEKYINVCLFYYTLHVRALCFCPESIYCLINVVFTLCRIYEINVPNTTFVSWTTDFIIENNDRILTKFRILEKDLLLNLCDFNFEK